MELALTILVHIVLGGTAIAEIALAVRLQRRSRDPMAALYLFALIFALLYGFFAFVAPSFSSLLVPFTGTETGTAEAIDRLFPFLAVPLLAASTLLFLAMMRAAISRKLSILFTILFVLITGLLFILNGLILYLTAHQHAIVTAGDPLLFRDLWQVFRMVVTIPAVVGAWMLAGSLQSVHRKHLVQRLAILLLVVEAGRGILFILTDLHPSCWLLHQIAWFAGDLVPLLMLERTLPRLHSDATADIENMLTGFAITAREREIIAWICEGKSNGEIADGLFISLQTVKTHISNIYRKLGVRSRVQLVNLLKHD